MLFRSIYYSAEKRGEVNLFRKPWDGSGDEERLTTNPVSQQPTCVTADGRGLIFQQEGDIWNLPLDSTGRAAGAPVPLLQSPAAELNGVVSPDGRWLAYTSNESNKREVFVTSYPDHQGKWQISTSGSGGCL